MAIIIGESGAFRSVREELAAAGTPISSLDELPRLRAELLESLEHGEANALARYQEVLRELQEHASSVQQWGRQTLEERERWQREKEDSEELRISQIRTRLSETAGIFSLIRHPGRVLPWLRDQRDLIKTRLALRSLRRAYRLFVTETEKAVAQAEGRLRFHVEYPHYFVADFLSGLERQMSAVTHVMEEGGAAGAAGELEVIEILGQLPDEWTILNDVLITHPTWISYNGSKLRTAQLDHVVVGPGGVFVIETKLWSRAFSEHGDYHDPYDQVGRAGYLCHRLLKAELLPDKVRTVIATNSKLPERPSGSFAKVQRTRQLPGYILWFPDKLNAGEVEAIVDVLSKRAGAERFPPVRR